MELMIFIFGFLFSLILQYAKLNKYDTISGIAIPKDFTVPKAILVALAVGTKEKVIKIKKFFGPLEVICVFNDLFMYLIICLCV